MGRPLHRDRLPEPQRKHPALQRKLRCSDSPMVNVDRLKPFFFARARTPPTPCADAGKEGEQEVELLLNRRLASRPCTVRGVTRYLVR